MPRKGYPVAVPVIKKGGIHIQYCIRKKLVNKTDFAGILCIDSLIIAVADFFDIAVFNELLNIVIENIPGIKLVCTQHTA